MPRVIPRTLPGRLARALLPVRLEMEALHAPWTRTLMTVGLQRSGQHAVIAWLCHCLGTAVHLNHCRYLRHGLGYVLAPLGGRRAIYEGGVIDDQTEPSTVFLERVHARRLDAAVYSLEDADLADRQLARTAALPRAQVVVILRDPYNWLASALRHKKQKVESLELKVQLLKQQLRHALGEEDALGQPVEAVNFVRFVTKSEYRQDLAQRLHVTVTQAAEDSLKRVQGFGGGSSFTGDAQHGNLSQDVMQRWRHSVTDPRFHALLADPELLALTERFFGELPHGAAVRAAMAQGAAAPSGFA